MPKKTVSLVLSSGGARGLAHIGAIRCLIDQGFDIRYISGSSMGAVVGGVYAAGKLDDYQDWVRTLKRKDIAGLLDFSWGRGGGLFKGERIISVLEDLVGDWQIEDLPVGFTAVATELFRKREIWISQGPLFDGIRASMAIPLILAPVRRGNQLLIDGGVLNPLPIAPTLINDADLIVAVDVNGMDERTINERIGLAPRAKTAEPDDDEVDDDSFRRTVLNFFDGLLGGDDDARVEEVSHGMFDIAIEAMDAMQVTISRLKLSVYSPDVILQIPRNVAHFFEFERGEELIELGYARMEETLTGP